jgi:cytochrome c oxidase cbb3-type subunit III
MLARLTMRSILGSTWPLLAAAILGSACSSNKSNPDAQPGAQAPASAEADRGQLVSTAPKPALTEAEQRGQAQYARMCAVCHGEQGEGYKADLAPALAHPEFLAAVPDEFLRVAILNGRRDTTMSAWGRHRGGPLTRADADDLIAFMRSWQTRPPLAPDARPLEGDEARGEAIYGRECARCHGEHGRTGPNIRIGDPELLAHAGNGFLRHAIARGRPGTIMPAYGETLGAQGIDDVIAYLRAVPAPARAAVPEPAKPPPIPLGRVPLNPKGPEPKGFLKHPETTQADVIHAQLARGARMALLDARAPSDYMTEHIRGAVSVPFYDPAPYLEELPKDAWLVAYCACPHAESRSLAQKLADAGFEKVTVLDEGLGYWKSKGYGVRTGVDP